MFGPKTHYKVRLKCKNCDQIQEVKIKLGITIGQHARDLVCNNCGVKDSWY